MFAFPKSLYSVYDTLKITVGHRPNAVVLDFFAGSGTTLHATTLLNARQSGQRQCILVSNNEVEAKVAEELKEKGVYPGTSSLRSTGCATASRGLAAKISCKAVETTERSCRVNISMEVR